MLDSRARNKQLTEDLDKSRNSMINSRSRNKKLTEDLAKVKEDLILTQEELTSTKEDLTSTKADLAFHVSALQTMHRNSSWCYWFNIFIESKFSTNSISIGRWIGR